MGLKVVSLPPDFSSSPEALAKEDRRSDFRVIFKALEKKLFFFLPDWKKALHLQPLRTRAVGQA
ncbi:hypothetical protein HC174_12365 [Salinimicrobium sp. CDJ15-81-2]|nr:hypothetical protein [Salinimicrobium nanhaiense]